MDISHTVPVAAGLTDMMLLTLLSIGLTFAEKLDRTYLPPPGSAFSGGSPDVINVPLELPNTKYTHKEAEGFNEAPEVVIGIDGVDPKIIDKTIHGLSTYKNNSFDEPTKTTYSQFKQSSPFNIIENYSTTKSPLSNIDNIGNFAPSFQPIHTTDKPQQYQTINIYPNNPSLDRHNQYYLPPRIDIEITKSATSSTIQPPIDNANYINHKYKYNQPNSNAYTPEMNAIDKLYKPTSPVSLQSYPEDLNSTGSSINNNQSYISQDLSHTTPISTHDRKVSIEMYKAEKLADRKQAESDKQATIIDYEQNVIPEGYAYSYDTSNGIHAHESGTTTNGVRAKGSHSYIGDDGNIYQVTYTADENGFLPKGAHLPTSPPIPDAILKVIEQAIKEKEEGLYDDGSYDENKYGYRQYQHHQNNHQANGGDLSTEKNILNIVPGYKFHQYDDLDMQNGLNAPLHTPRNNNDDHNNRYTNENQNITYPNKQYPDSLSFHHNQNAQKANNPLGDNINEFINNYPLMSGSGPPDINKNDIIANTTSGYQYFVPQSKFDLAKEIKSFPPRFSEDSNEFNEYSEDEQDNKSNKESGRPFLTPYVTRRDDDDSEDLFGENPVENKLSHKYKPVSELFIEDNIQPSSQSANIDKYLDSHAFISGIPGQPDRFMDDIQNSNNPAPSHKEDYFYQNSKHEGPDQPFLEPTLSYSSSTAQPTDLSSVNGSTHSRKNFHPHSLGNIMSFQKPQLVSTTLHDTSSAKAPLHPIETTNSMSFGNELVSDYPTVNSKPGVTSSDAKRIQGSRPELTEIGADFHIPYKQSTGAFIHPDGQSSTEYSIGEFMGPKQQQRFDPVTGYHY